MLDAVAVLRVGSIPENPLEGVEHGVDRGVHDRVNCDLKASVVSLGQELVQLLLGEEVAPPLVTDAGARGHVHEYLYPRHAQLGAEFLSGLVRLIPGPEALVLPAHGQVRVDPDSEVTALIQGHELVQPLLIHEEFRDTGPPGPERRLDGVFGRLASGPIPIADPVSMGIDEPGQHSPALQVHHLRPGLLEGENLVFGAYRHDTVPLNR